jgi:Ca2+/Na+ antiporter
MVGLYAALGLWISSLIQRRGLVPLVRVAILLIVLVVFVFAMAVGSNVLDHSTTDLDRLPGHWGSLLGMAVLGDHGLRLLDLDTFLRSWTEVDYGVLLGVALLGGVIVEIGLINVLIALAARRASRAARE